MKRAFKVGMQDQPDSDSNGDDLDDEMIWEDLDAFEQPPLSEGDKAVTISIVVPTVLDLRTHLLKMENSLQIVPIVRALPPVERVFSRGHIIMRPHRARLGQSMLQSLVFLKCNQVLL
ncbi:hypothetical protein PBY51_007142 [Eleginops maclovinus]|uniref:Uncharacterized protein n=1 Tax=Eleginops maclovinus TaxID=56733 RepID=A0AAN7X329_ELEMC|nr:hypothetical protein PBY51_007142 [Eleginops maclovinus]